MNKGSKPGGINRFTSNLNELSVWVTAIAVQLATMTIFAIDHLRNNAIQGIRKKSKFSGKLASLVSQVSDIVNVQPLENQAQLFIILCEEIFGLMVI